MIAWMSHFNSGYPDDEHSIGEWTIFINCGFAWISVYTHTHIYWKGCSNSHCFLTLYPSCERVLIGQTILKDWNFGLLVIICLFIFLHPGCESFRIGRNMALWPGDSDYPYIFRDGEILLLLLFNFIYFSITAYHS